MRFQWTLHGSACWPRVARVFFFFLLLIFFFVFFFISFLTIPLWVATGVELNYQQSLEQQQQQQRWCIIRTQNNVIYSLWQPHHHHHYRRWLHWLDSDGININNLQQSAPVSLNHCWCARCGDRSMEISVARLVTIGNFTKNAKWSRNSGSKT